MIGNKKAQLTKEQARRKSKLNENIKEDDIRGTIKL